MLTRPVEISAGTLAWAARSARLGEPHIAVAPPARLVPEGAAAAEARAELARLGALDRRGRLDVDLAAALGVLCAPRVEHYGWLDRDGVVLGVVVAAVGRGAVAAVRDGEVVRLRGARPDELAEALVAHLPDVPPARGRAVSVALEDARRSAGGRPVSPEVDFAQRVAALPTTGGGQLYAAVRDGAGRRQAALRPLRYADTIYGRWLNETSPDGARALIAPANPRNLVDRLTRMRRGLLR